MVNASWICVSVVTRWREAFLIRRSSSSLLILDAPSSRRLLCNRKPRSHVLQFSDHALHLLLSTNGDAHAAVAVRAVAQRYAAGAQSFEDGFFLFSETAENKVCVAGPAFEMELL